MSQNAPAPAGPDGVIVTVEKYSSKTIATIKLKLEQPAGATLPEAKAENARTQDSHPHQTSIVPQEHSPEAVGGAMGTGTEVAKIIAHREKLLADIGRIKEHDEDLVVRGNALALREKLLDSRENALAARESRLNLRETEIQIKETRLNNKAKLLDEKESVLHETERVLDHNEGVEYGDDEEEE